MIVNGYRLQGDWAIANMGSTAIAEKGDKKYFLKRYGEYKLPRRNASTSDRLYAKLEREFQEFVYNRGRINNLLQEIAGPGGNIISPVDWFVHDIHFIEATEFIGGVLTDREILSLSPEDLLFVMMTAAKAVKEIHGKNIVHSDLKRTNILVAKNPYGRIVAKIIDFDRSFFVGRTRENDLGGDQSYLSPELTWCLISECEGDLLDKLSTKADVFSLGLVFYNYLTKGKFPKITGLKGKLNERKKAGETVYCGEALISGAKLAISEKDGPDYLKNLLANMLYANPEKRISAQGVLDVLKTKAVLPLAADQGITVKTRAPATAKKITESFCSPWPEHKYVFIRPKIKTYGYIAAKRINKSDINCYEFYKTDGMSNIFTIDNLIILGWVNPKTPISEKEAWEEDSAYVLLHEKARLNGYTGIERAEKAGRRGYALMKADGTFQFVLMSHLLLLGYAKRK